MIPDELDQLRAYLLVLGPAQSVQAETAYQLLDIIDALQAELKLVMADLETAQQVVMLRDMQDGD